MSVEANKALLRRVLKRMAKATWIRSSPRSMTMSPGPPMRSRAIIVSAGRAGGAPASSKRFP